MAASAARAPNAPAGWLGRGHARPTRPGIWERLAAWPASALRHRAMNIKTPGYRVTGPAAGRGAKCARRGHVLLFGGKRPRFMTSKKKIAKKKATSSSRSLSGARGTADSKTNECKTVVVNFPLTTA